MRRWLRRLFVETGGANERPWNCLDGSRDPLAILGGIPSCSYLRAHLAFSDSKGLFDQRTRNGDSRSSAGLDRNRSSANWSCRLITKAGRCAERRWLRRCCWWLPCLTPSVLTAVPFNLLGETPCFLSVACPGGRTTNPEPLPVLRQRLGGRLDGHRYARGGYVRRCRTPSGWTLFSGLGEFAPRRGAKSPHGFHQLVFFLHTRPPPGLQPSDNRT